MNIVTLMVCGLLVLAFLSVLFMVVKKINLSNKIMVGLVACLGLQILSELGFYIFTTIQLY